MAELKIILRDYETKKPQSVCLKYYFGKDTLLYATKLKILPAFWDQEKQRVKNTKYCIEKDEINGALVEIEGSIKSFIIQSVKDGIDVDKSCLKKFLDIHFGKVKDSTSKDLHGFFKQFIEQCKTKINPKTGQIVAYKTVREYERTYYYLKEYEKKERVVLDFNYIDMDFYSNFTKYLQYLNLATNTIGHKITSLKAVLNAATDRGINTNTAFKNSNFKNVTEESEAVALNEAELDRIFQHDFSGNKRLERARDLFLIGAWTGLRFSDFTRIKKEYIKDDILFMEQQKTGGHVAIPLHPVFLKIWEKYDGQLPNNISNQKFNDYIKEVCQIAEINATVFKSITRGGRKETTSYEKWQIVSSHTARRSFATNLYLSGFPAISIMKITGHKTESAFLKYIKVTSEEHAKMLMEHWKKK